MHTHFHHVLHFSWRWAASGSFNSIVGRGSIKAFPALSLLSILHVPQLPLSLVSVSSLTKTYNCSVNFLFFVFFSILICLLGPEVRPDD